MKNVFDMITALKSDKKVTDGERRWTWKSNLKNVLDFITALKDDGKVTDEGGRWI